MKNKKNIIIQLKRENKTKNNNYLEKKIYKLKKHNANQTTVAKNIITYNKQ